MKQLHPRLAARTLSTVILLGLVLPVVGHIGSPNVFFEGMAGHFPLRVVIRPPGVIPGLAEVSIRVDASDITRVTALPMRWNSGRQGAPPPDRAMLVRGETNLYTAQLWFMEEGSQSVEVEVTGRSGSGKVIIPLNAIATRVLDMPRTLGGILASLGAMLFIFLVSIAGAASRESILPAGEIPGRRRLWWSRTVTGLTGVILGLLLWFGNNWWRSEALDYRHNRLYQPVETKAEVSRKLDQLTLQLKVTEKDFRKSAPLVPEHGKLMHLFLVRESQLDAFAHLHPRKVDWKTFETLLPNLPAGEYTAYADVTYETGLSDTMTARVTIPNHPNPYGGTPIGIGGLDQDDSWWLAAPLNAPASAVSPQRTRPLFGNYSMLWLLDENPVEQREMNLRFAVRDESGQSVPLEPFMGMLGHLILRRDDGSVFTHLHPSGSFSMAAQQLFELRAEGKAPLRVASATNDPLCQLPTVEESQPAWLRLNPRSPDDAISFPYAFPKPGNYRLWVQVKIDQEVQTGVFDTSALPSK